MLLLDLIKLFLTLLQHQTRLGLAKTVFYVDYGSKRHIGQLRTIEHRM